MTDETPKVDPKYYKPAGQAPQLAPGASKAFRAMLWAGIILAAVAVVFGLFWDWYAMLTLLPVAAPFFVGAGVVAGLGKRESDTP